MAISYPLNTPTNIGIANITLMAENAVAISQSPFTFQQQIVAHPGQRWAASISLPPMRRVDAENWVAFLLSLKGQVGTFLLGDPNCFDAQGSATELRNLFLYTEDFTIAPWAASVAGTSTRTNTTGSGGKLAQIVATSANGGIRQIETGLSAGQNYTVSFFLTNSSAVTTFVLENGTTAYGTATSCTITPSTGVISAVTGLVSSSSVPFADGCIYTLVLAPAGGTLSANCEWRIPTNGQTIFFGRPQFEAGTVGTTYQGVAGAYGPFVNGASQIGDTLLIDGCSPDVSTFFKAGDYIQLGSGSATNLYKVLTDTPTNSAGQATLDLWPNLRSSPGDDDLIVVANTKGRFRLKDNVTQWNINEISSYGITFDCVEAI
jgi:hypothetical protein